MNEQTDLVTTDAGNGMITQVPKITNQTIALMDVADRLGTWMAKAYKFKNLEQGKVAAMTCLTEGLKPSEFLQTYHVLENGQLQMSANAMLSKFVQLGGKYDIQKQTEEVCTVVFLWKKKETVQKFTIEQAKKKNLLKSQSAWEAWPEDQLLWTVVRKYMRRYVPEHFAGVWMPDGESEEALVAYSTQEPAKAQTILKDTSKREPVPPPPPSVEVVEVEMVKPEPPPAEPEPEPAKKAKKKKVAPAPARAPKLPPDTSIIEPNIPNLLEMMELAEISDDDALAFLRNVPHWLTDKQDLTDLKTSHIKSLMVRFGDFKTKVTDHKKGTAK